MPRVTRAVSMLVGVGLVVSAAVAPGTATAAPGPFNYKYATYSYPGAAETLIDGVNANGALVGTEGSAFRAQHAFYFSDGHYHLLRLPFGHVYAPAISVAGIADDGEIVGTYEPTNGDWDYGWIRSAKTHRYTRFSIPGADVPGSVGTVTQSVSPAGVISGIYETVSHLVRTLHGFYGRPGHFTTYTLQRPVADNVLQGAGLYFYWSGVFGGYYNQGRNGRAFYVQAGRRHAVVDPYTKPTTSYVNTSLVGRDRSGTIVGYCYNYGYGPIVGLNSFTDNNGTFQRIAVPGAVVRTGHYADDGSSDIGTEVDGTTAGGVIYGSYATNSRGATAGFVASP